MGQGIVLRQFHIHDFAIIDQLDLELDQGMTVFTGETGAGKSILVDALGLVLGDRADSTVVRSGCERAEITAVFSIKDHATASDLLREHGLEGNDAEECIVRRIIGNDGRSRAFIDGSPVPVQLLRELGNQLVDIHGQQEHHSLTRRDVQRNLLDDFAQHHDQLERITQAFDEWKQASEALQALQGSHHDRDARIALLRYQIQELEALRLGPSELEALEEEHARLANMNRIVEGCQGAVSASSEADGSAVEQLNRAVRGLQDLHAFDEALRPMTELLESAVIQVGEAAMGLRHYLDKLEANPERLNWVEDRISALQEMARKHHVPADKLLGQLSQLQREFQSLEHSEERFKELKAQQEKSYESYIRSAKALHDSRRRASGQLANAIMTNMRKLGMPGGRFTIEVRAIEGQDPSPHGMDQVEYLVTTNPGQALRPLSKVASGGELSRLSLAIQVIGAKGRGISTLVFDEIDAGIGGQVAEIVGQQLRTLAADRQVLCVTHLPQVASQSHHHVQVMKEARGQQTHTHIAVLNGYERVKEIARMLGGIKITEQTIKHAREMLEHGINA
ncbi:MAG: DNA repair protein RecN [Gammaproteobacteria bacterium]|nr:DNA repair protein RecN [Gammaproteobacteria bacterium]MCI0591368.1 DNA repair protein RecN [Gammaproteobacteria bacterium]